MPRISDSVDGFGNQEEKKEKAVGAIADSYQPVVFPESKNPFRHALRFPTSVI
jgi:hypothetical protein